jgi:hypothetical protein
VTYLSTEDTEMMLGINEILIIFNSRSEIMNFCNRIVATKAAKETPIICLDGVSFIHTT